jgi:hypothetical protein
MSFSRNKKFLPHIADLFVCPTRGVGYVVDVDAKCKFCKVIWFSEGIGTESTHYYEQINWDKSGLKHVSIVI